MLTALTGDATCLSIKLIDPYPKLTLYIYLYIYVEKYVEMYEFGCNFLRLEQVAYEITMSNSRIE